MPLKPVPHGVVDYLHQRDVGANVFKAFKPNLTQCKDYCQKDVRGHEGCVNALKFSHNEQLIASGGDDLHPRVWRVDEAMLRRKPQPLVAMKQRHTFNIFALEFTTDDDYLFSGAGEGTLIKHSIETGHMVWNMENEYGELIGLSQNTQDSNILAVTRRREVSIVDERDRLNPTVFRPDVVAKYYGAEFHPETPRIFLVNTRSRGPDVFDLRRPDQPILKPRDFEGAPRVGATSWSSGKWSRSGNQFMALRCDSTPVYFDMISKRAFALQGDDYVHRLTVKSMTFIDDYTVATGSDNWGIHIWKVPRADEQTGFRRGTREYDLDTPDYKVLKEAAVLRGHRSLPNEMDYSSMNHLLISSGVEKTIKLWSPIRLPWSYDIPFPRRRRGQYSHTCCHERSLERDNRLVIEAALDRDGEMDGRATWEDVFSKEPPLTAECRRILEAFDPVPPSDEATSGEEEGGNDDDDEEEEEVDDEEDGTEEDDVEPEDGGEDGHGEESGSDDESTGDDEQPTDVENDEAMRVYRNASDSPLEYNDSPAASSRAESDAEIEGYGADSDEDHVPQDFDEGDDGFNIGVLDGDDDADEEQFGDDEDEGDDDEGNDDVPDFD